MSRDEHSAERLSAYLDGALPERERGEVEEHLEGCERCRLLLDDLRILSGDLRAEVVPEVPEGLDAKVRRALDAERGRGTVVPFPGRWKIPATVAATLGAIALVALSFRFLPRESRAPLGFAEPARIAVPVESAKTSEPTLPEPAPPLPAPGKAAEAAPVRDEPAEVATGVGAEADREEPRAERLAAAFDASSRPAAPAAKYQRTITIARGPDCRETFEPFESPLRAAEGNLEAIEDRVDLLSGTRIAEEGRPYERDLEVRTEQWAEFLEFLTREGFVAEAEPKEIPPGADCVRVRIEIVPALPPVAQPPR